MSSAPFDPERIVRVLHKHGVEYVLVGALAARMQGFPRMTADADITPSRDAGNLTRLAAALNELDARISVDGIPEGIAFDCSPQTLSRASIWNLVTSAGRIDVIFEPSGTAGYEDLARKALEFDVFGARLQVADLKDIIRSKEASNRVQDRQDLAILRAIVERENK